MFALVSVRDKIYANFAGFNTFLRSSLSRSRTLTGDCLQDKKRAHPAALHISNSRLVARVTKYGVFIQKYCFKWHQIFASANLARWTENKLQGDELNFEVNRSSVWICIKGSYLSSATCRSQVTYKGLDQRGHVLISMFDFR